jgi:hypothetical protein
MDRWVELALTSVVTLLASSGFWAYMQHKDRARSATTRLLMGVAYNTITTLGIAYIDRGWVTKDELEELDKYFFKPYVELGGNGTAERVMNGVKTLPLSSYNRYQGVVHTPANEGTITNVPVVSRQEQNAASQ